MATSNPHPSHVAEALSRLRQALAQLIHSGYGRAIYVLDESGAPTHRETIITVPKRDEESIEQFIVRIWTNHKPLPHAAIEFSAQAGRITARITTRADGEVADLGEQLTLLRRQLQELAAHLEGEEPPA